MCHLQVTKSKVCISFSVVRRYKVARVQDAAVQVYDYYEPSRWSPETPRWFLTSCSRSRSPSSRSEEGHPHVQLGLSSPGRLLLLLRPRLQPLPAGRDLHRDLLAVGSLPHERRRHLLLDLPACRRRGVFHRVVIRKPSSTEKVQFGVVKLPRKSCCVLEAQCSNHLPNDYSI